MQQPAVPELAHAGPRPIHWLATAAAIAAVVAGSSLLQPGSATAAQPGSTRSTAQSGPLPAPLAIGIGYPLDCGNVGTKVTRQAHGDLDGDDRPETVASVRCNAGSGSPPEGIYVITWPAGAGQAPRVVATLLDPKDRRTVSDLALRNGTVSATLLGYSGPDVPSCCPDVQQKVTWHWHNGAFQRAEGDRAAGV